MIKMTITNAVVSQGYEGAPALNFSENGDNKFVKFRVGSSVYDKNAENKRRYVNMTVKAFNGMVTRIESMKLDAGMHVNVSGRYDEDTWEDKNNQKKSAPVLIIEDIEFCSGGPGKQNGDGSAPADSTSAPSKQTQAPSGNFTGYENFGGANPYFPEG